ncbi:MAG: hypothetical protein ACREHG_03335, partial [Candidatus Saccharimonadales bacterium]
IFDGYIQGSAPTENTKIGIIKAHLHGVFAVFSPKLQAAIKNIHGTLPNLTRLVGAKTRLNIPELGKSSEAYTPNQYHTRARNSIHRNNLVKVLKKTLDSELGEISAKQKAVIFTEAGFGKVLPINPITGQYVGTQQPDQQSTFVQRMLKKHAAVAKGAQ